MEENASTGVIIPWTTATAPDFDSVDFEAPLLNGNLADCFEVGALYRAASLSVHEEPDTKGNAVKRRVFDFLAGVTGMHFRPQELAEPFGPMFILVDGNRSAAASDFRGHVEILESLASKANCLVLRARLADLAWLLDRKRMSAAVLALTSYLEIGRHIEAGWLEFPQGQKHWAFHPTERNYLLRALSIARAIGWSRPESQVAQQRLLEVKARALAHRDPVPVHWYCSLDLDMGISPPAAVAREIENVLADPSRDAHTHALVELCRLASRAHHAAKAEHEAHRLKGMAADLIIAEADRTPSPLLTAHMLGNAIAELHGLPGAREKRRELRQRLVDAQAHVGEEMGTFGQKTDLTELVKAVQDQFKPLSAYDSLFVFAALSASPDPAELRANAIQQIRDFPIQSIFATAHIDDEGKVIHRTVGGEVGDADTGMIAKQKALIENVRRHIEVASCIDPARRTIIQAHYISEEIIFGIISQSPFVPPDLAHTFSRAFARFFQGDFTSALYILTPLVENSLRYVLKTHDLDVTTFDDATQTQEDRSLTSLYSAMRPELDDIFGRAITEDIERLFISRPGPALRHGVAHGLLQDGTPYGADSVYACWLVFRLCLIPILPHRNQLGLE